MAFTFKLELPITGAKMLFSWGVLALYSGVLLLMWRRTLGARHTAWLAVLSFLLPFVSLWIVAGKPAP